MGRRIGHRRKAGRLTPFDHDGQPAVLARVKKTDGGQEVTYLVRYPDAYLKALGDAPPASAQPANATESLTPLPPSFRSMPAKAFEMVKRPGDSDWVPLSSAQGLAISQLGPTYNNEVFPQ